MEIEIELRLFCPDIMLNNRLSQKLKLLGNDTFNLNHKSNRIDSMPS